MTTSLRVLIVGGYGVFGGRIVELLEDEPRLTLLVGGRSAEKARTFCAGRPAARATLQPATFDRDGDCASALRRLRPDLLIDASGPFQRYGEHRYRLIEACLDVGVNYLDLADGSAFVEGVAAFDARARAANLFVLSGVSSFPVLTAAVARHLTGGWRAVTAIRAGIAPSPFAGVGENVIRAIASYAGQPVQVRRAGAAVRGYPFTEQRRYTVAPPGRLPLNSTMFSLVDVPDLRVLSQLWPEAKDVWVGAGPVPEILHRMLIALAWLVRWRIIQSLSPLAPLMQFAINRLRWGEHRGGMFVNVEGVDANGVAATRSWHLLAEGDDGPFIPSMAIEALVRNMLKGQPPTPGARACLRDLELEDYERLFARRTIFTGERADAGSKDAPLYERILGDAWRDLPGAVRRLHDAAASATGSAKVTRGAHPFAHLAAAIIGFPPASDAVAVAVRFDHANGAETWTRSFAGRTFSSRQSEGGGRAAHLLRERFGPAAFDMALVLADGRLNLVLRRWRLFGVPLPLWLAPRSTAYEEESDGRFHFHVDIGHPLIGRIVSYEGWLAPTSQAACR